MIPVTKVNVNMPTSLESSKLMHLIFRNIKKNLINTIEYYEAEILK